MRTSPLETAIAPAIHALARAHPERLALVDEGGRSWTLAALDQAARRMQALLTGRDVVVLQAPNGPELVAAFLGALYAGAAVHPVHVATPAAELARRGLTPLSMDLLACAFAEDVAPASAPDPVDAHAPGLLLSTSGTTGEPRDIVIAHGSLAAHSHAVARVLGLGPDDRVLGVLPLAHSYGCRMALLAPLLAGASVHMLGRFSARGTLALIAERELTWAPVVPTMLAAWAALPVGAWPETPSLRWCLSAGAPLSEATRRAAEARLGCDVRQGYGLSEASFCTIDAPPAPRTPGSVGRAVPGVALRIVDGEVQVRGENLMLGYRGLDRAAENAFTSDGWLRTGDIGRLDEGGRLVVIDRQKDIVLVGGFTVHPAEVEAVLEACPGVVAASVVGVTDAFRGEVLEAHVVTEVNAFTDGFTALTAFVAERLEPWKVPVLWRRAEALPLGPSGKVLRRVLRSA